MLVIMLRKRRHEWISMTDVLWTLEWSSSCSQVSWRFSLIANLHFLKRPLHELQWYIQSVSVNVILLYYASLQIAKLTAACATQRPWVKDNQQKRSHFTLIFTVFLWWRMSLSGCWQAGQKKVFENKTEIERKSTKVWVNALTHCHWFSLLLFLWRLGER